MPRANPDHRIEDVSFRDAVIRCTCGWSARDENIERAWNGHRQEHGLTKK